MMNIKTGWRAGMNPSTRNATLAVAEFIGTAKPPVEARVRATTALLDTIGVILAGAAEPAANIIRRTIVDESQGNCTVLGTAQRAGAGEAALANGVAAHAHDYDDMCFVSLAHPSCALVRQYLLPENSRARQVPPFSTPMSSDLKSNAGLDW
jgi:2-methylcitrate dehydratase PrpD